MRFISSAQLSTSSILAISIWLGVFGSNAFSQSQETEIDELREQLELLKSQLEVLQTQNDILEEQRNIITNSAPVFPNVSGVTPLSGEIEFNEQPSVEAAILTFQEMQNVSEIICDEIKIEKPNTQELAILAADNRGNSDISASIRSYRFFLSQSNYFLSEYSSFDIRPDPPNVADFSFLGIPASVTRSVIDFLSLFRTNVDINNFNVSVPEMAFASSMFSSCSQKGIKIYLPTLSMYDTDSFDEIWGNLQQVINTWGKGRDLASTLAASSETSDKQRAAEITKLNDRIKSEFIDVYLTPESDEGDESNDDLLGAVVAGARFHKISESINSYFMEVDVLVSGGSNRTYRNLFGSREEYTGGIVVDYKILNSDGSILLSDTEYSFSGSSGFSGEVDSSQERN